MEPISRVIGPRSGIDRAQPVARLAPVARRREEEREEDENPRKPRRPRPRPADDDGRPHVDVQA